jgi:hypothetical protein
MNGFIKIFLIKYLKTTFKIYKLQNLGGFAITCVK